MVNNIAIDFLGPRKINTQGLVAIVPAQKFRSNVERLAILPPSQRRLART